MTVAYAAKNTAKNAAKNAATTAESSSLLNLTAEELEELRIAHEADRFHDECGVFGIQGHDEAAHIVYLGLYALQHRGQESCGIVASNGREHTAHRAMGLVADNFNEKILSRIEGRHAIGHVRYSTAGASHLRNAQPIYAKTDGGPVSIAHNGNLVNAVAIRKELEGRGAMKSRTRSSSKWTARCRVRHQSLATVVLPDPAAPPNNEITREAAQRISVQLRSAICRAASGRLGFTQLYYEPYRHSVSTPAATPCWAAASPDSNAAWMKAIALTTEQPVSSSRFAICVAARYEYRLAGEKKKSTRTATTLWMVSERGDAEKD